MELGEMVQKIEAFPQQARKKLFSDLKLSEVSYMPAGAILIGMQILNALDFPRIIDEVLGEEHITMEQLKHAYRVKHQPLVPSAGILICLLVADMLAYPKEIVRMYQVRELAEEWHTGPLLGIDPALLNDDRLLRTLSKLGEPEKAMKEILHWASMHVARSYHLPLSRFFVDTSVLQLDGLFASAPKVTAGRGTDSFSQLIASLTIAAGARLPVSFCAYPGNTGDSKTLQPALAELDQLVPPNQVIEWIGDRAFGTAKNIRFVQNQTDRTYRFISPLKTEKAGKPFRDVVDQAWDQEAWQPIAYRTAQERKKNAPRTYMAYDTEWTVTDEEKPPLEPGQTRRPRGSVVRHQETVRCVVYRHGNQASAEKKNRLEKRAACEAALNEFAGKINKRNLTTLEACQKKGQEIVKDFPAVKPFIKLDFALNPHQAVLFSWSWDEEAFARQERYDGIFALLTNHPQQDVSAQEAIVRYRDRNQVEMNFRDLRGLLDLERVFVQLPERIDAYLFLKVLAYFVLAFLRWYGQEHGLKHTKTLTEANIQKEFSKLGLGKVEIEPFGITKWSMANDNPLSAWYRAALELPDGREDVAVLNQIEAERAEPLMQYWLKQWEQAQIVLDDR